MHSLPHSKQTNQIFSIAGWASCKNFRQDVKFQISANQLLWGPSLQVQNTFAYRLYHIA